jgi:hypothetical protein
MGDLLVLAEANDLVVIEDCAHAYGTAYHGRKAGTMGQMACWSMQESKVLTAAGEGGVLTTDDEALGEIAASVCDHGKDKTAGEQEAGGYQIVRLGNNYRMSELHAAFGLAQLRKAERLREARRVRTEYLDGRLGDAPGLRRPTPWSEVGLSYAYYPVRFDEERFKVGLPQISAALKDEGIGNATIGRDELCHVHPLFVERCGRPSLPVAERIARELLLLPLYPDLTEGDLDDVVAAVRKVTDNYVI